jgi:hypothetical protein
MARLYVDSFESNNVTKYGIFDVWGDKPQLYTEDFQPLVFDTEEEAKARLAAIEAEKERSDKAIPFSVEDAKKYAESHFWKFASTYAKSAPHEYLVKRWLVKEDQLLFERFVATMKENSVVGYFYGHKNMYLILGDHYYWHMPGPENLAVDLINRTTTDYLEYRDGAYYYKEHG